ncbi:hypothetical protein RJD24_14685 [Bacillaceae bacterium IKA-2]|nr:hypothetical protein RJD24_14685 [Bacillaceae bacterium IKA-2]
MSDLKVLGLLAEVSVEKYRKMFKGFEEASLVIYDGMRYVMVETMDAETLFDSRYLISDEGVISHKECIYFGELFPIEAFDSDSNSEDGKFCFSSEACVEMDKEINEEILSQIEDVIRHKVTEQNYMK